MTRSERRQAFDLTGFWGAVDSVRVGRSMMWREVAFQAGVDPSVLSRRLSPSLPDIHNVAALARWAGISLDDFVIGQERMAAGQLGQIVVLLGCDSTLSPLARAKMITVLHALYEMTSIHDRQASVSDETDGPVPAKAEIQP